MSKLLQSYLRFWAKRYLGRAKPKVIAVTGSAGKTSTKEAIFEVLKIKFEKDLRKSAGNLNNQTGMPLAILGFQTAPSYAGSIFGWIPILISAPFKSLFGQKVKILILEMAADRPGDIQYLTSIVRPEIAVITSIGPAHLEEFKTIEKVADEKFILIKSLLPNGLAIGNIDDSVIEDRFSIIESAKTFGIQKETADITARNITTEIVDFKPITKFQIDDGKEKFAAEVYLLGRLVNIYPALAATAIGIALGLSKDEIVAGLKDIRPQEHRMSVLKGKNGGIILDDCYNANPLSMKAALNVLKDLPKAPNGKKIAVLGEMRELGEISHEAHRVIGEYAHNVSELVIGVGTMAKQYNPDKYFEDINTAGDYLVETTVSSDIILLKASLKSRFTELVTKLVV